MDNSQKTGSSFYPKGSDCFAAGPVSSSSANALLQPHEKDGNIMSEENGAETLQFGLWDRKRRSF